MSVNKVLLLGRLGQDVDLKYTTNGNAVGSFSVATTEKYKGKDGNQKEDTTWHNIVVWGKTAELCEQYLSKGRECFIEGRIQNRSWEDQNGDKKYRTEVVANSVQFIGGQGEKQNSPAQNSYQQKQQGSMNQDYNPSTNNDFTADSIPF
ncbi:MAG: single-stranded DNA-binding protein [Alphaproteobacteria bacterium]